MSLKNYSNKELLDELNWREKNPTWFIRELVASGVDCDNNGFRDATAWMDQGPSLEDNA